MQFSRIAGLAALFLGSAMAQSFDGTATYYDPDGGLGSCGYAIQNGDAVVAISETSPFYDNEYCGRTVTITNTGGGYGNQGTGRTVTATVGDTCPSCDDGHLDLTEGLFTSLVGTTEPGVVNIHWSFN